tara:strand:- start:520 stop:909 length:390 start_codon:yes stop_codon:yes gene_type:complete
MNTKKSDRRKIKKFLKIERSSKIVQMVFDHYTTVFKKNSLCKLNPSRKTLIKNSLKRHGYHNVITAITAMSKDTWGERAKYNDITYAIAIIKGIDNVEKWLTVAPTNSPVEKKKTKWEVMADKEMKEWN